MSQVFALLIALLIFIVATRGWDSQEYGPPSRSGRPIRGMRKEKRRSWIMEGGPEDHVVEERIVRLSYRESRGLELELQEKCISPLFFHHIF